MNLKQMLSEMLKTKGSDLHLRVGIRPYIRANGVLRNIDTEPISVEAMQTVVSQLLSEAQLQKFQKRNEMDLALSVARLGRFRINLFRQRGTTGVAI
ncbi:MAG: type IV pili twitching motility protein PilT, partial [candidate division Zixibacteria bacterium]|nr:type IV pili twitching motility protein PilT [candidate division Zixibacteria bacterium]